MATATYVLNSASTSVPIPLEDQTNKHPQVLPPGILVILSPGAVLTYSVEATGDDASLGYGLNGTNWNALDSMSGLTASANGTLAGRVRAIRLRVSAWTSGTATIQVIQ